jgi:hypothetical protein
VTVDVNIFNSVVPLNLLQELKGIGTVVWLFGCRPSWIVLVASDFSTDKTIDIFYDCLDLLDIAVAPANSRQLICVGRFSYLYIKFNATLCDKR